jgi:hypothetical protein
MLAVPRALNTPCRQCCLSRLTECVLIIKDIAAAASEGESAAGHGQFQAMMVHPVSKLHHAPHESPQLPSRLEHSRTELLSNSSGKFLMTTCPPTCAAGRPAISAHSAAEGGNAAAN